MKKFRVPTLIFILLFFLSGKIAAVDFMNPFQVMNPLYTFNLACSFVLGSHFDPISAALQIKRKIAAFGFLSSTKTEEPISSDGVAALAAKFENVQPDGQNLTDLSQSIYLTEGLGARFGLHPIGLFTLADPGIPSKSLPVLHIGGGLASLKNIGFNPPLLHAEIRRFAAPGYEMFPFEAIGAGVAIYEAQAASWLPKTLQTVHLAYKGLRGDIPMHALMKLPDIELKDPASFFSQFTPEEIRIMSHGYGRLTFFKAINIDEAIEIIDSKPYLNKDSAIRGAVMAYVFANITDLKIIMDHFYQLTDSPQRRSLIAGLTYTLVCLAWTYPGTIDSITPETSWQLAAVTDARDALTKMQELGKLLPFKLP